MSGFETVFGTEPSVFIGVTLVLMGGCAFMTGQGVASTWRPNWQIFPYALLLGCADRFATFALFQGRLFLLSGYLIDSLWMLIVLAFAYRVTRARQMATQYPWLYRRAGLLGWRERS